MLPENLQHKLSKQQACIYPQLHFPEKPLVAWNDSAECSRALQDALPILQSSQGVTLFLNPDQKLIRNEEYEEVQLFNYLKQHEIPCNVTQTHDDSTSTGEKLLECAQHEQSDLIVMGAYGRSRLRELLLGGTTRYVLKHTHVPVLMSH